MRNREGGRTFRRCGALCFVAAQHLFKKRSSDFAFANRKRAQEEKNRKTKKE